MRVDQERIEAFVRDPGTLDGIGDEVAADLESAVITLLIRSSVAAVAGAAILGLLVFRRTREPFIAAGLSLALIMTTAAMARATWRPQALTTPTHSGLLTNATTLIGSATRHRHPIRRLRPVAGEAGHQREQLVRRRANAAGR